MTRKISFISLGGTISSKVSSTGASPALDSSDLLSLVNAKIGEVEIVAVPYKPAPSASLTFQELYDIAALVKREIANGSEGVILSQGTDTLEESSFYLDLVHDSDVPVVVTGAMRNADLTGADGPSNILSSILVSLDSESWGMGVLVVMNDEIHTARYVRKTNTSSLSAFTSYPLGPIGWVSEGKIRIVMKPLKRVRLKFPEKESGKKVSLLKVTLSDDLRLLESVETLGYDGLILEAFGGGHMPNWNLDVIKRIAGKMPVILCSRTGSGDVLISTYGFPGSERDLISRGIIPAGDLSGAKARILLKLLLENGYGKDDVSDFIERNLY